MRSTRTRTSFLLYRWVVIAAALLGAASSMLLPPGPRRWLVALLGVAGAALWLLATAVIRPGWRDSRRPPSRPWSALLFAIAGVTAALAVSNSIIIRRTDSLLIQEGIRAASMIPVLAVAVLMRWWAYKMQLRRQPAAQAPDTTADPGSRL